MISRRLLPGVALAFILLALLVVFFWPVIVGGKTLLPFDNLLSIQPWKPFAEQFGVQVPHNELLSDLVLENYAWKRFLVEMVKSGQLPLWNPYILAGQPFLAAGQHSALYPLSIIFYILPIAQAYGWFIVLQLLCAGLFAYAYARTIRLSPLGATVTATVFMFSGFMIVSVVHPMIIAAASWLPLLLAVIERLIRIAEEQPGARITDYIPWVAAGAVALGLQFLAGHVELAYYVVLVMAYYAACRLGIVIWQRRAAGTAGGLLVGLVVMVGLGIGLASVQVIPLYELVKENFRQESATYQQVIGWAYPLRRVIAFLIPDFFGNPAHHSYVDVFSRQLVTDLRDSQGTPINTIYWGIKNYVEGGSYVGALSLLLALVAVWKVRSRYVGIFAVLAVVSLLFVFGTPLYAVLYYLLPGIKQSHSPFRWVFPFTFSIAVLAGCGASWLADQRSRLDLRAIRWVGVFVLTGGLSGLAALVLSPRFPGLVLPLADRALASLALAENAFADGRAFFSYQHRNLTVFFLALSGSGLVLTTSCILRDRRSALWKVLLCAVILAELFAIGRVFNPASDPRIAELQPPVVEFLKQDQGQWRFMTYIAPNEKTMNMNTGMFFDLQDARGYDSIIIKPYVEYMQCIEPQGELLYNRIAPLTQLSSLDSPLLDLLNVKYLISTQPIEHADFTLVYDREVRVYRHEDVLPRAFVTYKARVFSDRAALLEALPRLNPAEEVLLEQTSSRLLTGDDTPEAAPVTITQYRANEVTIEAELPQAGYLVLADTHFAGWKAYDSLAGAEEQEIPIYRANGTFRAVMLGPGRHTVRFKYTPLSLKLGLFVSFVSGMVLLLGIGLVLWNRFYREEVAGSDVQRVAKNALTPMILSLVNRAIDMVFAMLTLRILLPERAGRYTFAVNFIGYFEMLVMFGLGTMITREQSKYRDQCNRYVSNAVIIRLVLWLASIPVLGMVLSGYSRWGDIGSDTVLAIGFFFLAMIPTIFADAFTTVFYAHEKMEYPAAIMSVTTLMRVGLQALALLLGYGFVGLAAMSVVVNAATALILGYLVARLFFHPRLEFERSFAWGLLTSTVPLMINGMLSRVFFQVDVLLLQPIRGDAEVGYYGAAYRFVQGLQIIPSYFTMAIFPLVSRFAATQRDSLVRAYVLSVKMLVMIALPITVAAAFMARDLILFLAGPEYLPESMVALQVLVWYMPVGFVNSVTQYVLIAVDQQKFLTKAFAIGAVFNLLGNALLIPRYGFVAAASMTALSELALQLPFYYCVRKNLTTLPGAEIFARPVSAAAAMAGVFYALRGGPVLVALPLAATTYLLVLAILGTFRQPDVALVMGLLPGRLRVLARLVS